MKIAKLIVMTTVGFGMDSSTHWRAASILAALLYSTFSTTALSQVSLEGEQSGCNNESMGQDPACVSAAHRACIALNEGTAGFPQEVGNNVLGIACWNPNWYGEIPLNLGSLLTSFFPGLAL
jgi:hypothetical protein